MGRQDLRHILSSKSPQCSGRFSVFEGVFNMKSLLLVLPSLLSGAAAQTVGAYGQCGGNGWTGGVQCVSGFYCSVVNPWYSQCIAGANTLST